MATFTNISKNSASMFNLSKSGQSTTIPVGTPMGLLLSLTYAVEQTSSGTSYSNVSKNTATISNISKNTSTIANATKNTAIISNITKN